MKNPSHHYSVSQWAQHQNESPDLRALRFIKKFGLGSLLDYSFADLLKSVRGKKPSCFGLNFEEKIECGDSCKQKDSDSEVEGFFDLKGKALGPDCYGIFVSCWIASWIKKLGGH